MTKAPAHPSEYKLLAAQQHRTPPPAVDRDIQAPARGIAAGVVIGLAMWAMIIWGFL